MSVDFYSYVPVKQIRFTHIRPNDFKRLNEKDESCQYRQSALGLELLALVFCFAICPSWCRHSIFVVV